LLHQEERRADVDREHAIELIYRLVLDSGGGGDAGVGDEDIEPFADKLADLRRESVCAVGCAKIGANSIGVSAGCPEATSDSASVPALP
jgi:hypothetical protein